MRRVRAAVWSVLAGALVWGALVLPTTWTDLDVGSLLRLPVLGLAVVALLLLVPRAATAIGVLLALVVIGKVLDIGFSAVMDRPFHPVHDWPNLERGHDVLADWIGPGRAQAVVVALVVATVLVVVLLVPATRRVAHVVGAHRRGAVAVVVAGAVVVVAGASVRGSGVVTDRTVDFVAGQARAAVADLRDDEVFARQIASDPWAGRTDLLDELAGKDVLLVFVESYGRSAIADPEIAKGVTPVLDAGEEALGRAGVEARSGWLTSPTFGAGSWLAHATLQSGRWVDTDRRYEQLLGSERLTLTRVFDEAGWRTGFVLPAVETEPAATSSSPWPPAHDFYGADRLHTGDELGYRGPELGWGDIPDQYTLGWFRQEVQSESGPPVMAQIDLVSSHNPWPLPPPVVSWEGLGDGSVLACMPQCADEEPDDVRSRYAASIGYSLESVISFVAEHPDPDLVVVLVGDHQPWAYVTGEAPTHDVPVTLIAGDPTVLSRTAGWGWTPGLTPAGDAPVWRMHAFRDRFLQAFSGGGGAASWPDSPARE